MECGQRNEATASRCFDCNALLGTENTGSTAGGKPKFDLNGQPIERTSDQSVESTSPAELVQVQVVDISMPFGSMVAFMVKWAIASVPAFFILFFIFLILAAVLFPVFGIPLPWASY